MRKPDPLLWLAYIFFGIPMMLGLGLALWLMFGMYVTLWFGQETYDCVRALC